MRSDPVCQWGRRVLAALLVLGPALAGGAALDPAELMQRVQRQDAASDETVDFTMQLVDASGRVRQRTGTVFERQMAPDAVDEMRLIRFHSPPDFRDSGVLTLEQPDRDHEQWIYLPAYHTTRRIASSNRSDRYLGTDFLYEDIMRTKVEEYRYTLRGEEPCGGVRCFVIEAVPVAEQLRRETAYAKTVNWVDPSRDVILAVEYYDRDGRSFKRLTVARMEQVSGKYRWQEVRMEDFARHHVTIVTYHGRKIGTGIPERYFTERYLKRGR
jgi:outer membrane lipoprotein-sorting protein